MTVSVLRWVVKKAARRATVLASVVSGSLHLRRLVARGPVVRVLTYHRFGDAERDPWCVSARDFEQQMHWLAERRLAVSLDDIERFVRGEQDLADGSVLVTMDDGYSSVLHVAGIEPGPLACAGFHLRRAAARAEKSVAGAGQPDRHRDAGIGGVRTDLDA